MPLRFPGQYADDETGYSYNYFRFYDPSIGRYLQSDPLGIAVGLNTYTYVDDNPVNWVDPRGTCAQSAAIGALIAGGMEAMRQALVPLKCFHGIDWGRIGEAMAWGAAMGCGADLLGAALGGAAKWGQRFIDGEVGGGGGGIAGSGAGGDIGGGASRATGPDATASQAAENAGRAVRPGDSGTYGELNAQRRTFGQTPSRWTWITSRPLQRRSRREKPL
jgi:RHS repeat-associated protein